MSGPLSQSPQPPPAAAHHPVTIKSPSHDIPNGHSTSLNKTTNTKHVVPPRPVMLRQQHMDRYLWATIAEAYIERMAKQREAANDDEHRWKSEYSNSFHTEPLDHSAPDDALTRTYPLYGTAAVSFWCPTPVNKAPFGRGSCLTKPNSECYDKQFGWVSVYRCLYVHIIISCIYNLMYLWQ